MSDTGPLKCLVLIKKNADVLTPNNINATNMDPQTFVYI